MSKTNAHDGCGCACACRAPDNARRSLLTGALALVALAPATATRLAVAQEQPTAAKSTRKPEPGDKLAFMLGPKEGQQIQPGDIEAGKEPTLAYPMDPQTGKALVAKANLLTVVRLKPEELQPASAKNAADGIVAVLLAVHALRLSDHDAASEQDADRLQLPRLDLRRGQPWRRYPGAGHAAARDVAAGHSGRRAGGGRQVRRPARAADLLTPLAAPRTSPLERTTGRNA